MINFGFRETLLIKSTVKLMSIKKGKIVKYNCNRELNKLNQKIQGNLIENHTLFIGSNQMRKTYDQD